ncbi:MAG: hypothetical protein NC111_00945 [Bacteroides sp.]|nr:hypothetical protein [Bacteroides sp.]MCM1413531.1 hypothetical protein [Bacteroides sp.]MCM1471085.1 hypothetical protein [Bacteroides sp.]
MIDDEDYEDYFLDESEESRPEVERDSVRSDVNQRSSRTINFGVDNSNSNDNDNDRYRDRDHDDDDCAGVGCLSSAKKVGCGALAMLIAIVILGVIGYLRYLSPTADNAVMTAYVGKVERRGVIFKTYEMEIVEPERLSDTIATYSHSRSVSVANEELARQLQQYQQTGRPVKLQYEVYSASLPWRGESKLLVVGIRN